MKYKFTLLAATAFLASAALSQAAAIYNGSGTSGFGGVVGGSNMSWTDDGSTISVTFTKGPDNFNDQFVIYLANGSTGRGTIGTAVNDRQDALRSAISFMESSTGKTLTFPTGFEATHAIGINTSFGGLWSIPSTGTVGNNGLVFVDTVNSTLSSAGQSSFTFSFSASEIGLTANSGADIDFVATYLNPFGGNGNLGFASNEGYGGGFPNDNIGQNDFAFTSFNTYTIVPEPAAAVMGLFGTLLLLRRRR